VEPEILLTKPVLRCVECVWKQLAAYSQAGLNT
jgi:hypothetical protein